MPTSATSRLVNGWLEATIRPSGAVLAEGPPDAQPDAMSSDAQARVHAACWLHTRREKTESIWIVSVVSGQLDRPVFRTSPAQSGMQLHTKRIGGMLQPHPLSNSIDAASLFL
jgi:hypothetical protein